jgi:hypothetical protein
VHQEAQAKWRLGMAAYWLDTFCMVPESKDHNPPISARVSTNG